MDPVAATGLWQSSFGSVKIELDSNRGYGALMGVWRYELDGQAIIGFFSGVAQGNVLRFAWKEPAEPSPLVGHGELVFSVDGQSFTGKWWTDQRDRSGEWKGWRAAAMPSAPPPEVETVPKDPPSPSETVL